MQGAGIVQAKGYRQKGVDRGVQAWCRHRGAGGRVQSVCRHSAGKGVQRKGVLQGRIKKGASGVHSSRQRTAGVGAFWCRHKAAEGM